MRVPGRAYITSNEVSALRELINLKVYSRIEIKKIDFIVLNSVGCICNFNLKILFRLVKGDDICFSTVQSALVQFQDKNDPHSISNKSLET